MEKKVKFALLFSLMLTVFTCSSVLAGPLDSLAVDPYAQILQPEQTISVPANSGSGASLITPARGILAIDFAVQGNKQLLLVVMTNDQYSYFLRGQTPPGQPLMRVPINGTASQTVILDRGEYFIFFGNSGSPTNTMLTYRATWRRG